MREEVSRESKESLRRNQLGSNSEMLWQGRPSQMFMNNKNITPAPQSRKPSRNVL